VNPDDVQDHYEGSDVPGEFRRLTAELGCEQLSATLIRAPPHSDFEQGTSPATSSDAVNASSQIEAFWS
jgi:hypothetical protein